MQIRWKEREEEHIEVLCCDFKKEHLADQRSDSLMKSRLRCWKGSELSRTGRQPGMIGGVSLPFSRRGRERKLPGPSNSGILLKPLVPVFIKTGCLDTGVRSGAQSTGVVTTGAVRPGVNAARAVAKGGAPTLILMQTASKNKDRSGSTGFPACPPTYLLPVVGSLPGPSGRWGYVSQLETKHMTEQLVHRRGMWRESILTIKSGTQGGGQAGELGSSFRGRREELGPGTWRAAWGTGPGLKQPPDPRGCLPLK